MKEFRIAGFALAMLVIMTGIVMADQGVDQTFETQGVSLETSVQAIANMYNTDAVTWTELNKSVINVFDNRYVLDYYTGTYSEDTMSNGVGSILYDKTTGLETKAALNGQYNIEATKEIAFEGLDGAEITSTDNIFLSSVGRVSSTKDKAICVFGPSMSEYIPAFCNTVEAGSTITMEVVNARTVTNERFVLPSADTPVAVNHNIRVDMLGSQASEGKVSAFMEGSITEGRGNSSTWTLMSQGPGWSMYRLDPSTFETIEWSEASMVDGSVYLFDKDMSYESGIRRVREA
jgi:hypothetical protein